MEHGVDVPLMGKLELISHRGDDSGDLERAMTFGGQLDSAMRQG